MFLETLGIIALVIWAYVTGWFVVSRMLKRNDVADVAWGIGIALVGVSAFFLDEDPTVRSTVLVILGLIWGIRLGVHIGSRNLTKKGEDKRYIELAKNWGAWFIPISYLQVFVLQGLLMIVVGYPFVHASLYDAGGVDALLYIGVAIWLVGFIFESVGDYQLRAFLKKPENKGRIMKYGLWRYTRHPNYFGEVTQWWGIFVVMLSVPYGLAAIVSPLAISYLILKVSGIPMTEKPFEDNPEFQQYKKETSAFFPLPPKRV